MNVDENLTTADIGTSAADSPVKVPNYEDKDGNIYEYVSAEEDAKKGKAVGNVTLYAFRGVFNGRYRISAVDNDGRTQWYYECSNPCGVIKAYQQGRLIDRVPYNPGSIIGAAFQDAFNGLLAASKEPRTLQAATYEPPASAYYQPPESPPVTTEQQHDFDEGNTG